MRALFQEAAKRARTGILVATALVLGARTVAAHAGFDHYLGTIKSIDGKRLEIETTTKVVAFVLAADTRYLKKGSAIQRSEFKVGGHVVVDCRREKGQLLAKEVRMVIDDEDALARPRPRPRPRAH